MRAGASTATGVYAHPCSGLLYYYAVTTSANWWSTNTAIATVNNSTYKGRVTGVSPGTAQHRASFTDDVVDPDCFPYPYCCFYPLTNQDGGNTNVQPHITSIMPPRGLIGATTSVTISGSGFGINPTVNAGTGISVTRGSFSDTQIQASFIIASGAPSGIHNVTVTTAQGTSNSVSFYVQVPTKLSLVTTISQGSASCNPGMAGWDRWVRWQVLDQLNQPIERVMSVSDSVTIGSPNTCGASPMTGSADTDSSGQFPDHYWLCSTGCVGGTCQSNASQTWTVTGFVLSSDVKSIAYGCSSITINGQ